MTEPIERQQFTVSLPWMTAVGAKRLARQRGLTLDEYIGGLVSTDLAVEAEFIRGQLAAEEAELRGEIPLHELAFAADPARWFQAIEPASLLDTVAEAMGDDDA